MENILVLLHTEPDGSLHRAAFEAVAAALALRDDLPDSTFELGLVGAEIQSAADALAGCGAARISGVEGEAFAQPRYATDADAAEAICRHSGATIVLAPGTSRWNRVLAGAAFRLGGRADTHVTGLTAEQGSIRIARWFYRQRMRGVLERSHRPWFILLDPGCGQAWPAPAAAASAPAALEHIDTALDTSSVRTEVTGIRAPDEAQQTIRPDAALLFVAGAGWTKKQGDGQRHAAEAESLILDFLRRTQASLGSSKSLVDLSGEGERVLSFLTHMNQIGQTGATPRHPKGLAACCHGEEPHVVGWRFINERRAINIDANCGWARGKADVLYVADAFQVMARLNELL